MISIVTCTGRTEPLWPELIDSLVISMAKCPHPAELIVVDMKADEPGRRAKLDDAVKGRISYRHVLPKPDPWQGRFRKTTRDYSNHNCARNTGIALARGGYIALVDDCSVVDPDWISHHYRAALQGCAVAGAFKTYNTAAIETGVIVSGDLTSGQDHRIEHSGPIAKLCGGGWFFGLNSGAPMKYALAVNGYDEMFGGQAGGDDLDFGLRIERAGCKIYFMPDCMIYQILATHEMICNHNSWGAKQLATQKELTLRGNQVRYANEMLIQNLFDDAKRTLPVGNNFDLKKMREHALLTGEFPPVRDLELDWRDGQPLKDM